MKTPVNLRANALAWALDAPFSKFGRHPGMDLADTNHAVWDGAAAYSGFVAAAGATTLVSDDATDDDGNTGATRITVEGVDTNYNFVSQGVTTDGLNPVALGTNLLRCFRAYVTAAGTNTTNKGNITVAIGGATAAKITADKGQTLMLVYTVPADYAKGFALESLHMSLGNAANARAEVELMIREFGGAWRVRRSWGLTAGGPINDPVHILVPPKADLYVRVPTCSTNASYISGTLKGYLL